MKKHSGKIALPVITTVRALLDKPLPTGPVALHFGKKEWEQQLAAIPVTRAKPPGGTKGLLVRPDPYGNYLGFLVCVLEGVYCFPLLARGPRGEIIFKGCRCYDYVAENPDPPSPVPSCELRIQPNGKLACSGACETASQHCTVVARTQGLGGDVLVTCGCRRTP